MWSVSYTHLDVYKRQAVYGTRAEDMPSDKGWGTELAQQAYLEAAEAGTPVVTAESGASWCSVQAEHARGSVLYTIRAVGESGTEEQVRTSLDRVLETWLSAPEGDVYKRQIGPCVVCTIPAPCP